MKHSQRENKVYFNEEGYEELTRFLAEKNFSRIFVLVDQNTHIHCLPSFLSKLETTSTVEVVEMETGEMHKTIETCNGIWQVLSELGADRKSLIINLGGGVVTDLGGFVAATFKRGISCIHFPTTLLGMVDAAIGGKNGVNLDGLKNQIGVIRPPEMVVLDTAFLQTLPAAEMRSGLAEMLKHGLIQDENYWNKLSDLSNLDLSDLDSLIEESIDIKENVVRQDPTEQNLRKSLNFGHTLGHAIESYFLESSEKEKLLHGEAVSMYGQIEISREDQEKIIELLKFDKKNEAGKINFVLLRRIGEPVIDRQVTNDLIYEAFSYYLDKQ
jgi:3-dehydroquinate synthase